MHLHSAINWNNYLWKLLSLPNLCTLRAGSDIIFYLQSWRHVRGWVHLLASSEFPLGIDLEVHVQNMYSTCTEYVHVQNMYSTEYVHYIGYHITCTVQNLLSHNMYRICTVQNLLSHNMYSTELVISPCSTCGTWVWPHGP